MKAPFINDGNYLFSTEFSGNLNTRQLDGMNGVKFCIITRFGRFKIKVIS